MRAHACLYARARALLRSNLLAPPTGRTTAGQTISIVGKATCRLTNATDGTTGGARPLKRASRLEHGPIATEKCRSPSSSKSFTPRTVKLAAAPRSPAARTTERGTVPSDASDDTMKHSTSCDARAFSPTTTTCSSPASDTTRPVWPIDSILLASITNMP